MENVYAHTEAGGGYPAYVSLNSRRPGRFELSVRTANAAGGVSSVIELTHEQARVLAWSILAKLPECTVPPGGYWCSRPPGHLGLCAARPL